KNQRAEHGENRRGARNRARYGRAHPAIGFKIQKRNERRKKDSDRAKHRDGGNPEILEIEQERRQQPEKKRRRRNADERTGERRNFVQRRLAHDNGGAEEGSRHKRQERRRDGEASINHLVN